MAILILFVAFACAACGGSGSSGAGPKKNTPPTATITSPSDGSTYTQGDTISFNGTGKDTEDGTLTGSSLVWTSDIDGKIGTGTSFTRNDLSLQNHTITLTVTDSSKAVGDDTVRITIIPSEAPIPESYPAPTTTQESRPFPRPTDIFIWSSNMGNWSEHYQQGTLPELVEKTHPTVVGMVGDTAVGPDPFCRESHFRYNMEIHHAWGIKHFSQLSIWDIEQIHKLDPQDIPALLKAVCIDINGNVMTSGNAWQCTNNPVWRKYLLEIAQRSIDWGTDGFLIDEWEGTLASIYVPDGGCFCECCRQGFRSYLQVKYSAEKLKSFGIEDINSFDYGNFIRERYLTLYKQSRRDVPLFLDFEDYQMKSITQFWSEGIEEVKAYGITQGKEIYFSANTAQLYSNLIPIASYGLDYLSPEFTFGYPPHSRSIPVYQIGTSLGTPVLTSPQSSSTQIGDIMIRPDATTLWKIYTAEAYSARGFALEPYGCSNWLIDDRSRIFDGNIDDLSPYYDFIYTNKHYYENLVSSARTAVLYAYPSTRHRGTDNFYGICNLLLDVHYQYDVLFAGDDNWMKDKLSLDALQRYEVVVLPNTTHLSDNQVDLLLSYLSSGGRIISFGEIGSYNENNNKVERQKLKSLLTEGIHYYGSGRFVYMNGEIGSSYFKDRDASIREQFVDYLRRLIYPSIQTSAGEDVSTLEYWNSETQSIILHLINYSYDIDTQHLNSQENIYIEVLLYDELLGKNLALSFSSPDWTGVEKLEYVVSQKKIKFTIPKLNFYGIVSIGERGSVTP